MKPSYSVKEILTLIQQTRNMLELKNLFLIAKEEMNRYSLYEYKQIDDATNQRIAFFAVGRFLSDYQDPEEDV